MENIFHISHFFLSKVFSRSDWGAVVTAGQTHFALHILRARYSRVSASEFHFRVAEIIRESRCAGTGIGAGALLGRKCVRSESRRRCNRSLPKPPLLLVTAREVVRSAVAMAERKRVGEWGDERNGGREARQRATVCAIIQGAAGPNILLVIRFLGWSIFVVIRNVSRYPPETVVCHVHDKFSLQFVAHLFVADNLVCILIVHSMLNYLTSFYMQEDKLIQWNADYNQENHFCNKFRYNVGDNNLIYLFCYYYFFFY